MQRTTRTPPALGCLALLLLVLACDGSGGSTAPASVVPVRGTWLGSTSQGEPIQLTVDAIREAPGILAFSITFTFDEEIVPEGSSGCEIEQPGPFEIVQEVMVPVEGPGFSLTFPGSIEIATSAALTFRLDGVFESVDAVGGDFEITVDPGSTFGTCGARVIGTWTATPA